jgi:Spy/CpxP family protein refolding chaperone
MRAQNKYRILIGVIVILVATNLSMGISILYHTRQDRQLTEPTPEEKIEVPAQQRTRFFREQLNLSPNQVEVFRELNRDFNRTAWQVQNQLAGLRRSMVNEMGVKEIDEQELNDITTKIGDLHEELKNETIEYYLAMKEVCNEEQQEKLHQIFLSILEKNEDVKLPQGRRGLRNNM